VKSTLREEIQRVLQIAQEMPPEQLPRLVGELEEVRCIAFARLLVPRPVSEASSDRLLAIDEASRKLGVSKDYLYRHREDFPFTRRMGRKLLFSSHGIETFLRHDAGITAKRRSGNIPPTMACAARGSR